MATLHELNINCFDTFPELETRRLRLRQVTLSDVPAIFKMRSEGRNFQYTTKLPHKSIEEAEVLVSSMIDGYSNKQMLPWALETKDTQEFVGAFGLLNIDQSSSKAELGGELNLSHWGRQFATEACQMIAEYAFDRMNLHRLYAQVNPDNRSVVYYLEKFGFEKEAHHKDFAFVKGSYWDLAVYALINPAH